MSLADRFQRDRHLSELSTFAIGGPAEFFIEVTDIPMMQEVVAYCHQNQLRYCLVGKGSNILFDDKGFRGLVILNKIIFCRSQEEKCEVGAGYSFSLLGTQTARAGWAGLEFAAGIPGSVGGAVYMNAGAGGRETKDVLEEVSYVDEGGQLITLKRGEMQFGYRTSPFQQRRGAIVSALFILHSCAAAREAQQKLIAYRMRTQPYSERSAGSVFRNPNVEKAGALIERSGLKGYSIGDAIVSPLHANFIVNRGAATAQEVAELIAYVSQTVKRETGIDLEIEICKIPYDG